MNLSIELRHIENITIMELAGRVSVLERNLREVAGQLLERGERNFIINLANVSYLDNSGLGQLCWLYTVIRNRGGQMLLLKPTARIKKLLNITKLDGVFHSFDNEAEAIASIPHQISDLSISANGY
jgi:anti-sigma B factor antagonist